VLAQVLLNVDLFRPYPAADKIRLVDAFFLSLLLSFDITFCNHAELKGRKFPKFGYGHADGSGELHSANNAKGLATFYSFFGSSSGASAPKAAANASPIACITAGMFEYSSTRSITFSGVRSLSSCCKPAQMS